MKNRSIIIGISLLLFALTSCVQKTYKHAVTFEVNMKGVSAFESVGIAGDYEPLNWNSATALEDPDGDSIYSATFTFDIPYDVIEYKYVVDGYLVELEGQDKRKVEVKGKDAVTVSSVFDQP